MNSSTMTKDERDSFIGYLRACSDAQVQGVYEKEKAAGRREEVELALEEAARRGIALT